MTNTTDVTVQGVVEELTKQYIFAGAKPRPANAEVADALKAASNAFAGFALALHDLNEANPEKAAKIAKWWAAEGGREDASVDFSHWAFEIVEDSENVWEWGADAELAAENRAAKEAAVTAHPLAVTEELPAETTQPSGDWEDCDACSENQDMCRYHRGIVAGYDVLREAAKEAPDLTVTELLARLDAGE